MHGAVGGARAVLSGGKFKDGFVAAGFAQIAAPVIDNIDSSAGQVVAAGVAGGIGSELAGGDFESGFYTGVFSRAFNDNLHPDDGLRGNGPPIEDRPPGSASLTDLRHASPFDLLKFGNWGPYKGPWNIRDRYFADYPANDHSYLRNELTDQGNWDYGYAVVAAGLNVEILSPLLVVLGSLRLNLVLRL